MGESKSQPIYHMVFLPFIEWCVVVSAQENMRLYVFLSGPLQLLIPLSSYLYMNNINISPLFRKWLIVPPNFGSNACWEKLPTSWECIVLINIVNKYGFTNIKVMEVFLPKKKKLWKLAITNNDAFFLVCV